MVHDAFGERRPLSHRFAWAYDLLIPDQSALFAESVTPILSDLGITPGARLLDAGCGTGRHLIRLARCGYQMVGIDLSAELIEVARARVAKLEAPVSARVESLRVEDFRRFDHAEPYDAIICRGILNDALDVNDALDDRYRDAAFRCFADHLTRDGVLVLDVWDWERTVERCRTEPICDSMVELSDGELRFHSSGRLRADGLRLLVTERLTYRRDGVTEHYDAESVMRCWSAEELRSRLERAGLFEVTVRSGMPRRPLNSLLATAVKPPQQLMEQ